MTEQERRNGRRSTAAKRRKKRRIIFAIEILVLIILVIGLFVANKFSKIKSDKIKDSDVLVNEEVKNNKTLSGYRNIVLYGVDSREGKLTEDAHSDTIIIASINNKTKDVKLASVYRDTYLDNTNGEYRKATECYYFGGPKRSMDMLNKNLDLNITDYVTVDFNAISGLVDQLGGIDVELTEEEVMYVNGYCEETSLVTGRSYEELQSAGMNHLNGVQATSYARIRYTEGDDYKRTERQRLVIEKIIEKVKSADVFKLNKIIDVVLPMVSTSLSPTELISLASKASSFNMGETTGFPFDKTTGNIGSKGDCVIPVNLAQNVTQLHEFLFDNDGYKPSSTVEQIGQQITNDSGV